MTKGKKVTKIKLVTPHTKVKGEKTTQKKMSDSIPTKHPYTGKPKTGSAVDPTRKSPHSGGHGKRRMKSHSKGWLAINISALVVLQESGDRAMLLCTFVCRV